MLRHVLRRCPLLGSRNMPDDAGLPPLSAEVGWLIDRLRTRYRSDGPDAREDRWAELDWDVALVTARRNAIAPLIQRQVNQDRSETPPQEVRERLDALAASASLRALEQMRELLRVLDLLGEAGIRAVPYKGPVLAQVAYGDLGSRWFGDLDVLIDRANVGLALERLEADGYESDRKLTPRRLEALLRNGHDRVLTKEDRVAVEIQWSIASRAHVRPRGVGPLLDRAVTTTIGGREVPTLAPTDQVVVLAMHGCVHLYARLAWVCDVAEAMRVPGVDYRAALDIATGVGARRMFLLAVAIVDRVLDFRPAPEMAALIAADPAIERLLARILPATLARGGPDIGSSSGRVATRMRLADEPLDGLRRALRAVVTPTPSDWAAVDLPDVLYPLYAPVRLGRLVAFVLGGGRNRGEHDVFDEH